MTAGSSSIAPPRDSAKLPQGMKPLRDWMHARNLTLGLYTSDAERSCKKTAGSLFHESIDATTLAVEWGIKVDDCGEVNLNSFAKFSALRDASTGQACRWRSAASHASPPQSVGCLTSVINDARPATTANWRQATTLGGLPRSGSPASWRSPTPTTSDEISSKVRLGPQQCYVV